MMAVRATQIAVGTSGDSVVKLVFGLFAFGLIGLGMQITGKALKQAGGAPLIIGGVVGTLKAVGSLAAVLVLSRMFPAVFG